MVATNSCRTQQPLSGRAWTSAPGASPGIGEVHFGCGLPLPEAGERRPPKHPGPAADRQVAPGAVPEHAASGDGNTAAGDAGDGATPCRRVWIP